MSKYASLLFETENYHKIGPFRFPIYHTLLPGEAQGIEDITRRQSKSTYHTIKLAQRIAKDKGLATAEEALELLTSNKLDDENKQQFVLEYADEMEALQRDSMGATEQQCHFVTLFIKFRGEAVIPGSGSKQWTPLTDWTPEDTERNPFVQDIFKLMLWERDGWPSPEAEAGNEPEAPEEEEEKTKPASKKP